MKFFVNEGGMYFSALENYFNAKGCDLYFVQAEYKRPGKDDDPTDFRGIDIALELPEDAPLLFCSFMPESYFIKNEKFATKFFALMARKKTGFVDTINTPDGYYKKYLELVDSEKEADLLAIEMERSRKENELLGSLKHSIGYLTDENVLYQSKTLEAINKARQAGFSGDDKEILERIMNFTHDRSEAKFAGKYFPGIFCDLEGTLLTGNEVNLQLLNELNELSANKPITLWTSGDLKEYQRKLIAKGIFWKLVSKKDFFGAEVEIAFDDLSYEKFQSEFGIKVRSFNPTTSYNKNMELKLNFLHSLLVPTGISAVLSNPKFSSILNAAIESKQIREYVEEMIGQNRKDYNQTIVLLRDFLLQ